MPLPSPAARSPSHRRTVIYQSYRRSDGLWDIEAELRDEKGEPYHDMERGLLQPGVPIHDMAARVTIDNDMVVRASGSRHARHAILAVPRQRRRMPIPGRRQARRALAANPEPASWRCEGLHASSRGSLRRGHGRHADAVGAFSRASAAGGRRAGARTASPAFRRQLLFLGSEPFRRRPLPAAILRAR